MSPIAMTILLVVSFGFFAWTALQRWKLMGVAQAGENRVDRIGERVVATVKYVFGQARMPRYLWSGVAHILVFFGFMVLLINTLILWGRGYDASFDLFVFGLDNPLGVAYAFVRDIFTVLVIVGVVIFAYYRATKLARLSHGLEGWGILAIIFTMMVSDLAYHGGELVHRAGDDGGIVTAAMPFASLFGVVMSGLPTGLMDFLWAGGFWVHAALVLLFLNLLPYGKHFHILTVVPNVFAQNLQGVGRLRPLQDIEAKIEREETIGVQTVEDFSWKAVLDFYTCTECGRCSDHCPATNTGKKLSPKQLAVDIRDHMYAQQSFLLKVPKRNGAQGEHGGGAVGLKENEEFQLVDKVIEPEVLWACTTCGACEQECPVFISYVDKIVDMRRNLVMEQGAFPDELQTAFRGLETVGNPYSFPNEERAAWAAGLDVPLRSDKPDAEYLYWVGCAPSFDDRSRKIARAFAELLLEAGVDFAILGPEETCNGDPARRAGNEYLFQMFAQQNIELMNGYDVKKIITTCPHCFNILKDEYPEFGGNYEVTHHTTLLWELMRAGKLKPTHAVNRTIAYHDSCYIGRYHGLYDPPREILKAIPGLTVVEAAESRDRGMCCGAGGAQMWKEDEPGEMKVNHKRTGQLLNVLPNDDGAAAVATACPFCKTMLTDGLTDKGHEAVYQPDVAEVLRASVLGDVKAE